MEIDNIYNMDCLEGMKQIPDGTIDAVICDLPYGTTACAWDSVIPFDKLWEQYNRIAKPNAAIVLFGSEPFSSALRMSNIKEWRYDWIWHKPAGSNFMVAHRRPLKDYEIISVFYKEFGTYNPQPRKLEAHTIASVNGHKTKGIHAGDVYRQNHFQRKGYQNDATGFPKAVISFNSRFNNKYQKTTFHPTQKPVDLLRYLILTYSNEGDTILDATIGSGTTAVAALMEKRHFIGFETNKEYFDIAQGRIDEVKRNPTLF